ncbi:PIN domain-containing protein [Roseateles amylovorans]|uniref:Ribonuclease VapC n=1 Tax=Roseateles amylovorans TaxID=2978473 RepID=A0ABY6B4J3_9BURK|nr:PIN domain-containing protein [Roseateles amylovorans]UXH79962.1 PIN domain-containing protein [Roseateles amylovorans]
MRYMLDTNVVSALMREVACSGYSTSWRAINALKRDEVGLSVLVHNEVLFGLAKCPSPRRARQYQWVRRLIPVLPLTEDDHLPQHYARLRTLLESQGQRLETMDLLIAAHALSRDATLVSRDHGFARVPGLKLESWQHPRLTSVCEPTPGWRVR